MKAIYLVLSFFALSVIIGLGWIYYATALFILTCLVISEVIEYSVRKRDSDD